MTVWIYYAAAGLAVLAAGASWRRLRRERDALLKEKEVTFNFVHDVSEAFAESAPDAAQTDFLLKRVLFYAQQTAKARAGAIYFRESAADTLRARAIAGLFPPLAGGAAHEPPPGDGFFQRVETLVREQLIVSGQGLVGSVAERGEPLLIEDAERDPRVPRFRSEFLQIQSILLAPMRFQNTVMGVLAVVNRIDDAPFIQADLNLLQALADQASVTLYYARFHEELEKKRVLDDDLRVARRIQTALLPTRIPQPSGVAIGAFSEPAREIGGDYYDFVSIDEDHLGLAVADVSGKGVTGAMLMSICRSVFRSHAPGCLSPAAVLKAINRIIIGDIHEDMFVSMLYCVLNIRTSEITLACAGHPRPLLIAGGRPRPVSAAGVAIGLVEPDQFDHCLEEAVVRLEPGDLWILYTDGVTEALNEDFDEFGLERLQAAARASARRPAAEIVTQVTDSIRDHTGQTPQFDDMTLIVLKRQNMGKGPNG